MRKMRRVLAMAMALAMMLTTFGSDISVITSYAEEMTDIEQSDIDTVETPVEEGSENGEEQVSDVSAEGSGEAETSELAEDASTKSASGDSVNEDAIDAASTETSADDSASVASTDEATDSASNAASAATSDEAVTEPQYEYEFKDSTEVDNVKISLYAAKDVLPDDTTFVVTRVYPEVAEMIEEDLSNQAGEDTQVEVQETISFDITLYAKSMITEENPEGVVQPKDDRTVKVTFEGLSAVSDNVSDSDTGIAVYHVEDDLSDVNCETKVENITSDDVTFDAEHFSTYSVVIYRYVEMLGKMFGNEIKIEAKDINNTNNTIGSKSYYSFQTAYYGEEISPSELAESITGYKFVKATVGSSSNSKKIISFRLNWNQVQYTTTGKSWNNYSGTVYFWYEKINEKIPVAVYATDGTSSSDIDQHSQVLRDTLGLNYVQDDGYFPIGVVWLSQDVIDQGLNGDISAVINSIESIDTGYLTNRGIENNKNTVFANKSNIMLDKGGSAKSYRTAFFNWVNGGQSYEGHKNPEHKDSYGYENINYVDGDYKYHLDIRFDTNVVSYTEKYYTDNKIDSTKEKASSVAYLKNSNNNSAVSYEEIKSAAAETKDEYKLEGFYSDAACTNKISGDISVSSDTTIYVKYVKSGSYNVYFKDSEGNILKTVTRKTGEDHSITLYEGDAPTKEGYRFTGWSKAETSDNGDVTYTAQFIKQVTVSFVTTNDKVKTSSVITNQVIDEGENAVQPEAPTATGYTFAGWYIKNGDKENEYNFNTSVSEDITLYAHWTANKYTVTVKDEYVIGDTKTIVTRIAADKVEYGQSKTYKKASVIGYKFDSSSVKVSNNEAVQDGSEVILTVEDNTEIVFTYQADENVVVAFFLLNPKVEDAPNIGSQSSADYYPEGGKKSWNGTATNIDAINVTDLTEANGYSLSWGNINGYRAIYNWNNGVFDITDAKYNSETYSEISSYIASNYGNKKDEFSISDVIWYVYKRQSDGYHIDGYVSTYITYDPNYGENLATVTGSKLRYNTKATIAENPFVRNDGYAFAGWSTSKNGKVVYKPGDTIENLTSKLTLYAQWTDENVYEVTFKYGYDNGNNTDVFHYENGLKSGSKLTNVPEPERDGYDFSGWKDEDGNILTSDQIKNKAVIKNTTYTAEWTPKNDTKYTVEYYVQNLSDDGYSLYDTDWNPVTSNGTTDTLVVVSDFSNREITGFTYNEDKTAAYSREKEAGTVLESSLDSATIKGDGSLVIKLYYDRNSYTVRFLNYDGTVLDEGSYKYGDMPSYTKTTPVRNSNDKRKVYLFNNWDKEIVAVTMDADYTAQYTEKTLIVDEDRTVDTAPSTDDAPSQPDNNGDTTQTSASETSAVQTASNSTATISDQRIAMTDEPDVLGASRDASKDDAAVLGERRYSTGDYDYTYKYLIIIIAAGLIITQLYFGFGKKQSDK